MVWGGGSLYNLNGGFKISSVDVFKFVLREEPNLGFKDFIQFFYSLYAIPQIIGTAATISVWTKNSYLLAYGYQSRGTLEQLGYVGGDRHYGGTLFIVQYVLLLFGQILINNRNQFRLSICTFIKYIYKNDCN